MHETAQKALEQINDKGYALPYQTDNRRVVKVGLHFDLDSRTLDDWVIFTEATFPSVATR